MLMFSPMYLVLVIINIKEYWFDDAVIGLLLVLSPMYCESIIITIVVWNQWREEADLGVLLLPRQMYLEIWTIIFHERSD